MVADGRLLTSLKIFFKRFNVGMFKYSSELFQTCYPHTCTDAHKQTQVSYEWVWWERMFLCVCSIGSALGKKYRCMTQTQRNFPVTQSKRLSDYFLVLMSGNGRRVSLVIFTYTQAINLFPVSPGKLQNFLPFLVSKQTSQNLFRYMHGIYI